MKGEEEGEGGGGRGRANHSPSPRQFRAKVGVPVTDHAEKGFQMFGRGGGGGVSPTIVA